MAWLRFGPRHGSSQLDPVREGRLRLVAEHAGRNVQGRGKRVRVRQGWFDGQLSAPGIIEIIC